MIDFIHVLGRPGHQRIFPQQCHRVLPRLVRHVRVNLLAVKIKRIVRLYKIPVLGPPQGSINHLPFHMREHGFPAFHPGDIHHYPVMVRMEDAQIQVIQFPVPHPHTQRIGKIIARSIRILRVSEALAQYLAGLPAVRIDIATLQALFREPQPPVLAGRVAHRVPRMPLARLRAIRIIINGSRDAQRPHHVERQVTGIRAGTHAVVQQERSPQVRQRHLPVVHEALFLHRVCHHGSRLYHVCPPVHGVQQAGVTPFIRLSPILQFFVPHPVRQYQFAEVLKRQVLVPRPLSPGVKSPVYVVYQVIRRYHPGVIHLLHPPAGLVLPTFYPLRQDNAVGVHGEQQGFPGIHCRPLKPVILRHVLYQETCRLILQPAVAVVLQHPLQFRPVLPGKLQRRVQSAVVPAPHDQRHKQYD